MCLAIPMQIKQINDTLARCVARGIEREVNIFMLQATQLKPGDYVLVHVGYAIQKIDPDAARLAWEIDSKIHNHDKGQLNA